MRAAGVFALALLGCGPPSGVENPEGRNAAVRACTYDVHVTDEGVGVLDVIARCEGSAVRGFRATKPASVAYISQARSLEPTPLQRDGVLYGGPAQLSYRVDLGLLGREHVDFDVALQMGGGVVAPVASWILAPEPATPGAPIAIRVTTAAGQGFSTALERDGETHTLEAHEIRVGTYSVFGEFDVAPVELPGPLALENGSSHRSTLEVATLRGELDAPPEHILDWIRDSALAVSKFWRGFPAERALLTIIPIREREGVVYGKVLPAGGPGISLMLGQHSNRPRLDRDWVLVHELFHLGVPSFFREGKWFDEGLATYYEPIIRARAGILQEQDVWREFVDNMRRGVEAMESTGLENAESFGSVYWGGALACLLADVEIRKHSGGRLGLEDGLRAVLAQGGSAPHVWPLTKTLDQIDQAVGIRAVGAVADRYAQDGAPVALDPLLQQLGVVRGAEGIRLSDTAELAPIRRAMVFGKAGR